MALYEEGRLWLERAVALGGDIPPLLRSDRLLEGVGGALSPEISWMRDRYLSTVTQSLRLEDFASARDEGR